MKPYYQDEWVTIYHGDCREILPQLDVKVDLVLTDPPYGINYKHGYSYSSKKSVGTRHYASVMVGDDKPFDPIFLLQYPNIILWGANNYASKLPDSRGWLVWDKRVVDVTNDFSDCDMAWTNRNHSIKIFRHRWCGIYRDSQNGERSLHPTEKPVSLMAWCMNMYPNCQLILDPFLGSGTTAYCAKDLNRKCIGIEIEEKYCEIAAKRCSQGVFDLR